MMNMHQKPQKEIHEAWFWAAAILIGIGLGAVTHALLAWLVPIG